MKNYEEPNFAVNYHLSESYNTFNRCRIAGIRSIDRNIPCGKENDFPDYLDYCTSCIDRFRCSRYMNNLFGYTKKLEEENNKAIDMYVGGFFGEVSDIKETCKNKFVCKCNCCGKYYIVTGSQIFNDEIMYCEDCLNRKAHGYVDPWMG